jgi:site-specific DNA-methyltransferase (adenine-specific)
MPLSLDQIICGDCLEVMAGMEENSVDSIITDPPYGFAFMGKEWDTFAPEYIERHRDERRYAKGKATGSPAKTAGTYDQSMEGHIKFYDAMIPWAKAALRVAKPGAMLLAFGGTRTHHRLMCAIEDAGWEIRDILMWLHGQGFPKSLNHFWPGYGTALKPAFEPIVLAMKPLDGTFAQNAEKWGVAGLWIEGGRINYSGEVKRTTRMSDEKDFHINPSGWPECSRPANRLSTPPSSGRWPANVLLGHHEECVCVGEKEIHSKDGYSPIDFRPTGKQGAVAVTRNVKRGIHFGGPDGTETVPDWRCHPDCPVRLLDEMSGELTSGAILPHYHNRGGRPPIGTFEIRDRSGEHNIPASSGGASRFFYCGKAPSGERFFLCRDCDAVFPAKQREAHSHGKDGKEAWSHLVYHPTQKPLHLMEYLCRLTKTPTGGIVLDPFAGTGTTCLAARNVGRPFIGIEKDTEYCRIDEHRLSLREHQLQFAEAP